MTLREWETQTLRETEKDSERTRSFIAIEIGLQEESWEKKTESEGVTEREIESGRERERGRESVDEEGREWNK